MYTEYDIISGLNTSELTFPKRWTEPSLAAASVARLLIVANAGKVDYQRWKSSLSSSFSLRNWVKICFWREISFNIFVLPILDWRMITGWKNDFEKSSAYWSIVAWTRARAVISYYALSSESGCTTRDSLRTKPSLVIHDRTCLYAVVWGWYRGRCEISFTLAIIANKPLHIWM